MAKVVIYKNIFDLRDCNVIDIDSEKTVREVLEDSKVDECHFASEAEIFDPETGETTFAVIEDSAESLNVSIKANGKSQGLDYRIESTDLVTVEIIPADMNADVKRGVGAGLLIAGLLAVTAAVIIGVATGGVGFGVFALGVLGLAAAAGGIELMLDSGKNESSMSSLDEESSPSISGSQNQLLLDAPFPLVIGRVNATPYVIGSPYNEYVIDPNDTDTWFGRRQTLTELLAIAYAPLFIQDINLDQLPLVHNYNNVLSGMLQYKTMEVQTPNGTASVPCYLDGRTGTYQPIQFNGQYAKRDIEKTWLANKVQVELSQFGQHRTLYTKTIKQKKVNANLLYCYDKAYSSIGTEEYITWQGGSFPRGMRTNTVIFSESVPYRVVVGLSFPKGLYRSYTHELNTRYDKIPMNLVIQWRPIYKYMSVNGLDTSGEGEEVYDHDSGEYTKKRFLGWRNFSNTAIIDGDTLVPIPTLKYISNNDINYYTYSLNGVPAFQDGYYGYYTNTTGYALSGEFHPVQKKTTYSERYDRGYKNYLLRYVDGLGDDSSSEWEYDLLQTVINTGIVSYSTGMLWWKKRYTQTFEEFIKSRPIYTAEVLSRAESYARACGNTDEDAQWCLHQNKTVEITDSDPTTKREISMNKGLTEGTEYDANPAWNGVTAFSFGSFSCGRKFYKTNSSDPSLTDSTIGGDDIDYARDEMKFEVSAELNQEDILDLLNKNPKSQLAGEDDVSLNGLTDVTIDSIQVRVIRLTPCYIGKNEGEKNYTYSDFVKWDYLKTYCIDKQKLLDDIEHLTEKVTVDGRETYISKIDCNLKTFDSTEADVHSVPTWNSWDIHDYISKPISDDDAEKLATLAIKVEADTLGTINGSLNKINMTAYAVTPALKSEYIRYWYVSGDDYRYYDSYDSESSKASEELYLTYTENDDRWKRSTAEEFAGYETAPLTKNGTAVEGYYFTVMNREWDKKFFPCKVEKKENLQLMTDAVGNVQYNAHGDPLAESVRFGNDWIQFAKREMSRNIDSSGRWIASEAFRETFLDQNAMAQALGFMIGQSLGRNAYYFNSLNDSRFIRYWYVSSGRYWYYDTDDIDYIEAHKPVWSDVETDGLPQWVYDGWQEGTEVLFGSDTAVQIDSEYWYSFRAADSSFNMMVLKESLEYTDGIDVGGAVGKIPYKCNLYVTSQQKVINLMQTILVCARGYWYYDELGRFNLLNDKPKKNPVLMITDENSFGSTNTRSFAKGIAGYHILFQDENNGFLQNELYVLREGQSREAHTRDIIDTNLTGVTNPSQAWAIGAYMLANSIIQKETWERKLNHLGGALTIGSLVSVQSSTLEIGTDMSGRILKLIEDEDYIYGFICDRTYEYRGEYALDGRNVQGCSILQMGAKNNSKIVTMRFASESQQHAGISVLTEDERFLDSVGFFKNLKGQTNLILFEKRIIKATETLQREIDDEELDESVLIQFIPKPGDVVAFGNVGAITKLGIVYGLSTDEKGRVTVSMYPYYDELYTAGEKLPLCTSGMTKKARNDSVPLQDSVSITDLNIAEAENRKLLSQNIKELNDGTYDDILPPDNITGFTAVADQNDIYLAWSPLGQGLRNTVQKYTVQVSFDSGVTWEDAGTSKTNSFDFILDHSLYGYLEWEDFSTWRFRVSVTSVYSRVSRWTESGVLTDSYGTWLLTVPSIELKSENRTIMLTMSSSSRIQGRKLYGTTHYKVRVMRPFQPDSYISVCYWMHDLQTGSYWYLCTNDSKVKNTRIKTVDWMPGDAVEFNRAAAKPYDTLGDDNPDHEYFYSARYSDIPGDTEWHKPDGARDYLEHHDNYKAVSEPAAEKDRYVKSDSVYIQTMPLYYTDSSVKNFVDTQYKFDVCAYNEAGDSEWYSGANIYAAGNGGRIAVAQCTNLRDIVSANETAKEAYISSLSAISANLGEIRQGTLGGSDNNYWTLSDKTSRLSDADYEGAFRVGGAHEYLKVTPIIDQITHIGTGEFKIEFNVGNFNVTSDNTNLNGEIIAYPEPQYDSEGNLLPPKERARINHNGIYFEVRDDGISPWRDVVHQSKTGTVTPSLQTNPNTANGSLVITNASMGDRRKNGSDIGLPLPASDAEVWHFDTDFYNQHGQNTLTIEDEAGGVEHTLVGEGDTPTGAITDFTPALLAIAPYATVAKSIYGNFSLSKTFSASNSWQVEFWMKHIYNENQTIFSIGNSQQSITLRVRNAEPYYNVPDTENEEPPYDNGIIEHDIAYNMPVAKDLYLEYVSPSGTEAYHYLTLEENQWYHVGVFCDDDSGTITVYLSKVATRTAYTFAQSARFVDDITVEINPSKKLMCVDELMVSPTVAGSQSDFNQNTTNRIPFGALDRSKKHFVLDVDDSNVWTNLFDNTTVRNQIKEIVREVLQEEGLIARR